MNIKGHHLVSDVKYNPEAHECRIEFNKEGQDTFGVSAYTSTREEEALGLYQSGRYNRLEDCFEDLVMTSLLEK